MDRNYTRRVLNCIYNVYYELGPGLLESIYQEALISELRDNGFFVEEEQEIPVYYKGKKLKTRFRLDLIVDRKLIIELKSVKEYHKVFEKQLYTYLRLLNCELGYVFNFYVDKFSDGIHTVHNTLYNPLLPYSLDI